MFAFVFILNVSNTHAHTFDKFTKYKGCGCKVPINENLTLSNITTVETNLNQITKAQKESFIKLKNNLATIPSQARKDALNDNTAFLKSQAQVVNILNKIKSDEATYATQANITTLSKKIDALNVIHKNFDQKYSHFYN